MSALMAATAAVEAVGIESEGLVGGFDGEEGLAIFAAEGDGEIREAARIVGMAERLDVGVDEGCGCLRGWRCEGGLDGEIVASGVGFDLTKADEGAGGDDAGADRIWGEGEGGLGVGETLLEEVDGIEVVAAEEKRGERFWILDCLIILGISLRGCLAPLGFRFWIGFEGVEFGGEFFDVG